MNSNFIYTSILEESKLKSKGLAVLIDPDKINPTGLSKLIDISEKVNVDYFFVGGSLIVRNELENCIAYIKKRSNIPIIIFPGSNLQIHPDANALLLLSLISGRNADALIGQHVIAAPYLKESQLEIISTGYILIDGGAPTTVSYMSNSTPIPHDKPEIAMCTALAGEMLGMKMIYLDAGSGALQPISKEMISEVKKSIHIPLIVGGGIKTPEKAAENCAAGADLIVIGNALEKDPLLLSEISMVVHAHEKVL